ncbi:hemerythrin domain-containing protein [Ottowia testudinis]|uniref:Hemerythrin domain-containing protein n=1 Tax=Ottowia testudinis TaxID=2816950 RepID=A0A975H5K7_9BURK|nr:hemerythrin domain-containing protein [Ottowia testudinis]
MFDFLDHSHQQLQRQLGVLKRLARQLAQDELTARERDELRQVIAWFNTDARQHHLDEEKHVFPALLESSDEHVVHTTRRLRQDHGWIEENWLELAPSLEAAAGGYSWFDRDTLAHGVAVFEQLCLDHLVLEESLAYPEARERIHPADLERAGVEMARRRAEREARSAKR